MENMCIEGKNRGEGRKGRGKKKRNIKILDTC
jgi:hypothetical protein